MVQVMRSIPQRPGARAQPCKRKRAHSPQPRSRSPALPPTNLCGFQDGDFAVRLRVFDHDLHPVLQIRLHRSLKGNKSQCLSVDGSKKRPARGERDKSQCLLTVVIPLPSGLWVTWKQGKFTKPSSPPSSPASPISPQSDKAEKETESVSVDGL